MNSINTQQSLIISTITLIGVGLIGGSLCLDLKRLGIVKNVIGVDIDEQNLTHALERKVIDRAFTEINHESIHQADMVIIATPVGALPSICQKLARVVSKNTIITDVGSTKELAINAFNQYLPAYFSHFVAAHPIAGSDRNGALAAQFNLFKNKKCILCAHEQQEKKAFTKIQTMWQAVGAEIFYLNAQAHDEIFATVSHLPHLLSFAYMHQIGLNPNSEELLYFAGSGFKDFTRIAGSDPTIWADICFANQASLLHLLKQQQQQLDILQQAIKSQDKKVLSNFFKMAQRTREKWENEQGN